MSDRAPARAQTRERLKAEFDLLDEDDVALLLGVTTDTLAKWRVDGDGPTPTRIKRTVFYTRADLAAYIAECRDGSAPQPARLAPLKPDQVAEAAQAAGEGMNARQRPVPVVVEHDEGSAFGVAFPDRPGLFAAADDEADLPAAIADALALWGEGEAPAS